MNSSSSSKSNKLGGQQYYHQEKHYKNAEQEDSNSSLENKQKGSSKYKRKQVEIKLFVGQIPKTWEENDLKTFFEKYGEIMKVQVIRDKNNQHKGCAFVVFASILCANIAIEALKATKLPGMQNNIQVKWADNEPDRLGIRQDQDYVLYVAHIPKNASEPEIRNVFENYGVVKEVDIPKDQSGTSRGYVFVKYENIEQAILAKQALHEKQVLNNQTQSLVVKFYDPKKKQTQGNQGQQQGQSGPSSNNYSNNGQGQSHHSNRDNQGQSNYYSSSSQPQMYSQNQQPIQRNSDNYNYQRDQHSNYNQGNQQQGYRGGQGNYHGHHDGNKGPYNQNNQNYQRENANLNNSEHYDQPSQSFDSFQSHSSNFREQQFGNQNLQQPQNNSYPHQSRSNNNTNNNNFQYSSSYPSNQPAGNNLNNSQFNQTYNSNNNQGSDYNYQNPQQNDYVPPPQGQNNFQFNDYQQQNHISNNGPVPNGTNNNNQIQQFNPYYNNENFDNFNNPQIHNDQPNFNQNQPPQQQIPQHEVNQPLLFNLPQQQPVNPSPSLDISQPSSTNYQEQIPPVEPNSQPIQQKAYIKYYTEDKVPYYYDTQTQSTSYDQPPLGSIIYNPDGTQEHVQPESIEQLQKFQQETGLAENKELEILSQKTTGPPGANLFIFHLPNDYRDSDLLRLFKKFGDLLSARVITRPDGSSKGYGFVSYTSPDGAQQAIQNMNGLQVGKKKLKVEVKKGQGDGDLPPSLSQNGYQPF
ncbi:hypothetical protein ABPG74_014002 [Tetrahymena malaccensis]